MGPGTDWVPVVKTIGGYNPQSWQSSTADGTGRVVTESIADRTAFIFNLTDSLIQQQSTALSGAAGTFDRGKYQTINSPAYGPTFGGWEHDIYVYIDLDGGWVQPGCYSTPDGQTILGNYGSVYQVSYSGLEVFALDSFTPVPEPSTYIAGIEIAALWMLGACISRNRKHRA